MKGKKLYRRPYKGIGPCYGKGFTGNTCRVNAVYIVRIAHPSIMGNWLSRCSECAAKLADGREIVDC